MLLLKNVLLFAGVNSTIMWYYAITVMSRGALARPGVTLTLGPHVPCPVAWSATDSHEDSQYKVGALDLELWRP